jgi:cytoskeletal protein CcmA (bactofilin family)
MFSKDKNQKIMAANNDQIDPRTHNQIVQGTIISGEINSNGVIRFDGELKGNLNTKGKLVIGPTGSIIGDIKCKNADIEGIVDGKIIVEELLTLKATSRFKGEIVTRKLSVEAGAMFDGSCTMASKTPEKEDATPKIIKK